MTGALIFAAGVVIGECAMLAALAIGRATGADEGFGLDPTLPPDFTDARGSLSGRAGSFSPDQAGGPAQFTPVHGSGVNDA